MFLEAGYLVYILFLLVFTVLAGVRFAKTKKAATAILALLFTVGAYCFFEFSFLPLPLNMKGLQAIGDSMVPLSETVVWIPFSRLADYVASYGKEGFRYYFQTWMLSLLLAGFFMGFSFRGLTRKPASLLRCAVFSVSVPCGALLVSFAVRLFTGVLWKPVDVTNILYFAGAFWLAIFLQGMLQRFFRRERGGRRNEKM